jgi:hypothetical protein
MMHIQFLKRTGLLWLCLTIACSATTAYAQQKVTLSGSITDKARGETLIGVSVALISGTTQGATSNEYGFYSLSVPAGVYTLRVNYVGYQTFAQKIDLKQNTRLDIQLEDGAMLEEVVVKAEKRNENIEKPLMRVDKISMLEVKSLPTLLGERDVLKTIQLLPGVKSAGEGNSGFYVRGGGADQNLILLDEAPVYNASHLLGFFSTFNADAIKDATLYKGGMPAQYGGRLSSVLDIKMNDGNNQKFNVSGGIGLISSKLNVEGPVQKGRSSFLVTGRRTYVDAFFKASPDTTISNTKLYFYDLNAKFNYVLNDKNRLYVSGYFGRDKLGLGDQFGIDWGNTTATMRLNHVFSDRLFSNTSLIYSQYDNNISLSSGTNDLTVSSKIRDYNLKQDFQWFPNNRNTLKYGFQVIHHTVTPSTIEASESSSLNSREAQDRFGLESAAYFSHEWQATPRFNLMYGLRLSMFNVLGAGDFYTYGSNGEILNTETYQSGEIVSTYVNPEPRLAASYVLTPSSSVKLGYNRNVQNLHLLSNSTSSNPTDLWMPTTNYVKPEIADQISLGYFKNFGPDQQFEVNGEVYYKYMQNQVDYRNGADLNGNTNVEKELLFGSGRAYGLEMILKKKTGKLNGWVSYTLSRTERKIDGINDGNYYVAKQDRTHDLAIVAMYELSKRWSLSGNWIFYTGNAITFPSGKYEIDGATTWLYTERNGYRMPNYHRLDLGATFHARKTKRLQSDWAFSVYNAYNRKNAYTITFRDSTDKPGTTEAVKTALFGIIPSISWNFKF